MRYIIEYMESMHSGWLASSIACCFPRLPDLSKPEPPSKCRNRSRHIAHANPIEALGDTRDVCCEQPRSVEPLTLETEDSQSASQHIRRPTPRLTEGRSFASRASSRASFSSRRNGGRRPTVGSIGAPYDFKKVGYPHGRREGFRPLTLSIHLPGNELPSLPEFDEASLEDACLTFPPPALTKSKSDPMLLRRLSTAFSIPRKPVPSRAVSMDASRASVDSRYTFNDNGRASQSLYRRPSLAPSDSTQDLLDALDARLPQSPPPSRPKAGAEPVYTLYRKASDQSLRLRTHLEERQQIERRFPECDTIMEDREGDPDKSPTMTRQTGPALLGEEGIPPTQQEPAKSIEEITSQRPRALSSTRSRISAWLLRTNPVPVKDEFPPFYSLRSDASATKKRASVSSSVYSTSSSTAAETTNTAWTTTTPRSSPHRKGSSFASCPGYGAVGGEGMEYGYGEGDGACDC